MATEIETAEKYKIVKNLVVIEPVEMTFKAICGGFDKLNRHISVLFNDFQKYLDFFMITDFCKDSAISISQN